LVNLDESKPLSTEISILAYTTPVSALISQGNSSLTNWTILQPNVFSSINVTRSVVDIGQPATIQVTFSTPIIVPNGYQVVASIPSSQFVLTNNYGISLTLNNNAVATQVLSEDTNFVNFTTGSLSCGSQQCGPLSGSTLLITGFSNPENILSTLTSIYFAIISPDNYTVLDSSSISLYASPSLAIEQLSVFIVNQTGSLMVGADTAYEIKF
jgi:hypothetical protein